MFFSENLQIPSLYFKNNCHKENLEYSCVYYFLGSPKCAKLVLSIVKAKTIFL